MKNEEDIIIESVAIEDEEGHKTPFKKTFDIPRLALQTTIQREGEERKNRTEDLLSEKEEQETEYSLWIKKNVFAGFIIVLWYLFSVFVVTSNDWLLTYYNFDFPIFITFCHMLQCFVQSRCSITSRVYNHASNRLTRFFGVMDYDSVDETSLLETQDRYVSSDTCQLFFVPKENLISACLLCLFFIGDITLANLSFKYIGVSKSQVINSLATLIVFIISLFSKSEKFDLRILLAIILVIFGSMLSSIEDIEGNLNGFIIAGVSMLLGAFKAILLAKELSPPKGMYPVELLALLSFPSMIITGLTFAFVELPYMMKTDYSYAGGFGTVALIFWNSLGAFFLNLTAFALIKQTSALTYEVLGNFKDVFMYIVAILLLKEDLSASNLTGGFILIAGLVFYTIFRVSIEKKDRLQKIIFIKSSVFVKKPWI